VNNSVSAAVVYIVVVRSTLRHGITTEGKDGDWEYIYHIVGFAMAEVIYKTLSMIQRF